MKARIHTRRLFTSEVGDRAIPTLTIKACYPMFTRQRECHSYYHDVHYYVQLTAFFIGYDASRCDEKMNMIILRCSQIEDESKSNHNCNSRLRQSSLTYAKLKVSCHCRVPVQVESTHPSDDRPANTVVCQSHAHMKLRSKSQISQPLQ